MASRTLRWLAPFCAALGALHACAVSPTPPARERIPVVLDNNRPLYIRRSEVDRYTCGGAIRVVCHGANRTWLMCRCPIVGP
jgi:hypothetical protein